MVRYMPKLEAWFHYRNLDVSTVKELCKRWKPEVAKGFEKKADHTALADIRESIAELKYYREHFIKLESGPRDFAPFSLFGAVAARFAAVEMEDGASVAVAGAFSFPCLLPSGRR